MMNKKIQTHILLLSIILTSAVYSCSSEHTEKRAIEKEATNQLIAPTEGERWVNDAIEAHGGEFYNSAHFQFNFRGKTYEFQNNGIDYTYHLIEQKENGVEWKHTISNGDFSLTVNDDNIELSAIDEKKYYEALNSVIYFATLPSKLSDEAVIVDQKGESLINDTTYQLIVIHFEKENGGTDYEDEFMYWINHETKKIDYLAYRYKDKQESGTRFRKAYNRRVVNGITFQDYINYKGEPDIDLYRLAEQYEKGELTELSRIKTENVIEIK